MNVRTLTIQVRLGPSTYVCEEKGNIKLFTETDSSTCVDETL